MTMRFAPSLVTLALLVVASPLAAQPSARPPAKAPTTTATQAATRAGKAAATAARSATASATEAARVDGPAPAAKDDLVTVALDTAAGKIVLALDRGRAPATVANFLAYADKGWYDGEAFYRAMPWGKGGLIQAGVRNGLHQLPPVKHEPTSVTGLKNVAGAIALANGGAGTARSDFFIMTTDLPALDESATQPGFAAFGHVVSGMEVVKAILASPVDPDKGTGAMKGQMLTPTVKIISVKRVAP